MSSLRPATQSVMHDRLAWVWLLGWPCALNGEWVRSVNVNSDLPVIMPMLVLILLWLWPRSLAGLLVAQIDQRTGTAPLVGDHVPRAACWPLPRVAATSSRKWNSSSRAANNSGGVAQSSEALDHMTSVFITVSQADRPHTDRSRTPIVAYKAVWISRYERAISIYARRGMMRLRRGRV